MPPKSLFLEPFPSQLVTVPACHSCNSGFSELDTAFREFVSFSIGTSNPQTSKFWRERALPGILKNQRRLTEIRSTTFRARLVDSSSRSYQERGVLPIDADIQDRMVKRLVRGLWFKRYREVLPALIPIEVSLLEDFEGFEQLLSRSETHNIGDQFEFSVYRPDASSTSCWLFAFQGGHPSMAMTGLATVDFGIRADSE